MAEEFDLSSVDQGIIGDDLFPSVPLLSESTQARKAQKALILTGNDVDPVEATAQTNNPDVDAVISDAMYARTQASTNTLAALMHDRITGAVDIQEVNDQFQEIENTAEKPDIVEEVVVRALSQDADERTITHETARLYAATMLQELMDKQGIADTVFDAAGQMFIPFGLTADLSDVEDLKFDWTNATDVESIIVDYQALSPEQKIAVFPGLMEAVLEATGTTIAGVDVSEQNVLQAATILGKFFDPEGETSIVTERRVDIAFGALDFGAVGATTKGVKAAKGLLGSAARNAAAKTNTARVAAATGNKVKAAEVTIASAKDSSIAKAHGVDRTTAAMNALPVDRSTTDLSYAPEINDAISASLNEFTRQTDGLTRKIIDDQLLIRAGALNDFEKGQFIRGWEARLEKNVSDQFNDEVHVMNMKIQNVDETGFTATYDLRFMNQPTPQAIAGLRKRRLNLETKLERGEDVQTDLNDVIEQLNATKRRKPQRVQEDVVFTIDENGNFNYTAKESSEASRALGSPSFWSYTKEGGDFNDSFKTAGVTTDLEAAFSQNIETMVDEAWSPVSGFGQRQARKDVEDVLFAGDVYMNENGARGYVYNVNELIAGVDTGNRIVRLTDPRQIEAYYRMRAVADNFWRIENHAARRRLELNGFSNSIKIDDGYAAVRTLDSATFAKQSLRNRSSRTGSAAYDYSSGEVIDLTDGLIDEQYALGKVLTRTSDSKAIRKIDGETEYVDYIFVNRNDLAPLPQQVTHFKRGYVPKINKGIEFLVKESLPISKRGAKDATTQKTVRFFASKRDAERFADEFAQRAVDEGRYPTFKAAREVIQSVADRELTPMQRVHEQIGASGGLFTGTRSQDDILSGIKGAYTERVGVYEAMARNARHLGSLVARNESRIGDEQRWLNTLQPFGIENAGFIGTRLPDDRIGRSLEAMRRQIKAWNGVPQIDETAFQGVVQNLHDWVLEGARRLPGLQNKQSVKSVLWLKHSDLAASLKSATMHAVLGVLNPAQLIVQASAMSVAITRYPRYAAQMMRYGFRMGMADMVRDNKSLKTVSAYMSKVDKETPLFDEIYDAWNRSGLRESVRSNADLVASENYGVMTAKTMQKLGDASLLFYRQGELMNRRAAFITSYLARKEKFPNKVFDNSDLLEIRKDANLTMLELNQANRAWWQGGPQTGSLRQMFGVMTQFQQVAAKSLELVFKGAKRGGFTPREKLRILAGQAGLFGAAGIPFVGQLMSEVATWTGAKLDQDEINRWNQGLLIGSVLNAMDMDIDVANRVSAFGQINQFIKDLLFDEVPLIEKFLGVGYDVGSRALDAMHKIRPLMASTWENKELSPVDLEIALTELAKTASSGRNLMKAWVMHNAHVIRDRHGNIIDASNYDLATEIGVALGFRPSIESETRILQMTNRDFNDLVSQQADTYLDLTLRYLDMINSGDPQLAKEAGDQLVNVMALLAASNADNPIITSKVQERIKSKLEAQKTLRDKAIAEWIDNRLTDEIYEGAKADRMKILGKLGTDTAIVAPLARELEEQKRGNE